MDLFTFISQHIPSLSIVMLLLSFVFQVSKIPINPWSWVIKQVSNAITKEVKLQLDVIESDYNKKDQEILDKINELSTKLSELNKDFDIDKAKRLRGDILTFANSIRNGVKYSREDYHHYIEKNDEYHELIKKRDIPNGVIERAMETILNSYQEHEEKNDFLS